MIRLACWLASLVLVFFGVVLLVGGAKLGQEPLMFDGICILIASGVWWVLPDILRD